MNSNNGSVRFGKKTLFWITTLIVLCGLTPPLIYWGTLGRIPTVTAVEACDMLREAPAQTLLLDVRTASEFEQRHIQGAVNMPLENIIDTKDVELLPELLREKTILLLCNSGGRSALAAKHLCNLEIQSYNVRGGMCEWVHGTRGTVGEDFFCFQNAAGQPIPFPFREAPIHEQLALVISGLGFKPLYTFLSFVLIVVLWRSKDSDLTALRWGMVFFFLGENACAANYWFFDETSYLLEYLHGYGMLLCFAFTIYAIIEGIDRRIIMLSNSKRKCAFLPLCGRCIKYSDAPCGLQRVFLLIVPACIVIAFMPMSADWQLASYNSDAFGTLYNYSHPIVYQYFELVYCPLVAIVLLGISFVNLLFKRHDPMPFAKIAFAAGFGPLGFAMFRMLVTGPYGQNLVWRNFWEECTELLFIIGVCYVIWLFRRNLFSIRPVVSQF